MARRHAAGMGGASATVFALGLLLCAAGCGREARPDRPGPLVPPSAPGGEPDASEFDRATQASLSEREAWAAALSVRRDIGPHRLEDLGRKGFFSGRLCPGGEGGWELEAGDPLAGYRLDWSCATCAESSGETRGPGGVDLAAIGPESAIRPWPRDESPAEEVERQVSRLLEAWGEAGHPLGRVRASTRRTDSLLVVALDAQPGPAVRVDRLLFEGRRITRVEYLERLLAWRGGEPWRTGRWDAGRAALLGTGLFDEVDGPWLQRPPGGQAAGDTLAVAVVFRLSEQRVNSFTGLVGYTGKTGRMSGFVHLELGNLFGTGRRGRVLWQSQRESSSRFEFGWHEPYVGRLPVGLDLELAHTLEDTLYAETRWGLDLVASAGAGWEVRGGWSWGRLVVGGEGGEDRRRQTARFGVGRREPLGTRRPRAWELGLDLAATEDGRETVRHGLGRLRAWTSGRRWMVLVEEQAGLVAGVDDVLRGDALSIGGASSLRGYFETAYRATRSLVQRLEVGPAPTRAGTRFYALADLGWLREWRPYPEGIVGAGEEDRVLWSAGLGLQTPSRAGDLRLDYAAPGGEPIWRGRIHLGLVNRF